jgi:hypothetical protein
MTGFALLVSLLAVLVSVGCGASSSSDTGNGGPVPAKVIGTVAVGTAPNAIAVDSTSNKIYVTDFGTPTPLGGQTCSPSGADVMLIDGATQSTTSIGFGFVWGLL